MNSHFCVPNCEPTLRVSGATNEVWRLRPQLLAHAWTCADGPRKRLTKGVYGPLICRSMRLHRRSPHSICNRTWLVFAPNGESVRQLLDDFVGAGEQCWRNVDGERMGGRQIDDEIELGRLYHRQVGGLLAFQDTTGIDTNLPIGFGDAGPVAHQAAGFGVPAQVVDRR